MATELWRLTMLDRWRDAALLALRVATGVFLVDGVWDNVVIAGRMTEFAGFLGASGFAMPSFWAPFSVYTQLAFGLLLVLGLLTRWAGIGLIATFIVGIFVVHWQQSLREIWPALALVVIGAMLATHGAGLFSIDRLFERRR